MNLWKTIAFIPAVAMTATMAHAMNVQKTNKSKSQISVKTDKNTSLAVGDVLSVGKDCLYTVRSLRNNTAIAKVKSCNNKAQVKKNVKIEVEEFAMNNTSTNTTMNVNRNSKVVTTSEKALRRNERSYGVGLGFHMANAIKYGNNELKVNTPVSLEMTSGKINDQNFGLLIESSFIFGGKFPEVANGKYTAIKMGFNPAYEISEDNIIYGGINYPVILDNLNIGISGDVGYQIGFARRLANDILIDAAYRIENYTIDNFVSAEAGSLSGIQIKTSFFF